MSKKTKKNNYDYENIENFNESIFNGKLKPKTENQKLYLESIEKNKITFCCGPAGCGKTYIPSLYGLKGLLDGKYQKMIISRPLVQADESTGYLPGGINHKLDPYLQPIYDAFSYVIIGNEIEDLIARKKIEIVPFAYMRGRNFFNSFILFDEASNCTYNQLLLALTRFSRNSTMVFAGDITQSDLPFKQRGGYESIIENLNNIEDIGVVHLDNSDIIREPIIKTILEKLGNESL